MGGKNLCKDMKERKEGWGRGGKEANRWAGRDGRDEAGREGQGDIFFIVEERSRGNS